jgi:hypothetical protein
MVHPKLRRVLTMAALLSALSLLPAQAAGSGSWAPRGISLAERIESWELRAWNFLAGLLAKRNGELNPDGVRTTTSDSGHSGH